MKISVVLKFMLLTTVKSTTSIESVVFVSHVEFFSFTHCDTFFHHSFIQVVLLLPLLLAAAAVIASCCCLPLRLLLIVGRVVVHNTVGSDACSAAPHILLYLGAV